MKWAIRTFKSFKSPGPDGIYPALLKQGLDILTSRLLKIFKASIALGIVPTPWSKVTVVFIPKPGQVSYADPKAFRPISLMSFLLKCLEKLVDRHIRQEVLTKNPLHRLQFAYQPGKSTESAIHCLVSKIEDTIRNKEIALGGFFDIEGAFNNTDFDVIKQACQKRGINPLLTKWMINMLKSRKVNAKLFDESITIRTTRGCPQGGCLSCLLWSLVVDDLISSLNNIGGVFAIGYADDIVIYITGKYGITVSEIMQRAIRRLEKWCGDVKLSVNPLKSMIVPFTNRYKFSDLKKIYLFGQRIELSKEAKYLGVTLDTRLNWKAHIEKTIEKAIRCFWACRRMVGRTWGLQPKMISWLYTHVIIPKITYGAIAWWHKTNEKTTANKLEAIQRMAELAITGAMRTTPTAAMNMLLGLPPLSITIEAVATLSAHRLACLGLWCDYETKTGHKSLNTFLTREKDSWKNTDRIVCQYFFDPPFKVEIKDREAWTEKELKKGEKEVFWFSDASKTDSGTGIGVHCDTLTNDLSISLNNSSSVFQAEIFAIDQCAKECLKMGCNVDSVCIYSDSQAALRALDSYATKSKTVLNCLKSIEELSANRKVTLKWIPAHSGFIGNEKADELAKTASSKTHPEITLNICSSGMKNKMKSWVKTTHLKQWNCTADLRVSKMLIPFITDEIRDEILNMNRKNLRLLVGVLTGHCGLRKHLFNMKIISDPTCRFCGLADETADHILCSCSEMATKRLSHLGKVIITTDEIKKLKLRNILNFAKSWEIFGK